MNYRSRNGWLGSVGIWPLLMLSMLMSAGCARKLPPSIPADDRGCYVGVVPDDATQVSAIKVWAPRAQAGDLVITPACDQAREDELTNWAKRWLFGGK